MNTLPPKNIKQGRRLLGLLNWFRDFVPDMSSKVIQITDKLKNKDKKWIWTEDDEKQRQGIFKEIVEENKIYHIEPQIDFVKYTDASDYGIAGVLMQLGKIVWIYSSKLTESEVNYTIVKKELYAIIKTLEHFHASIWGSYLTIYTDSKNTSYLKETQCTRTGRWKNILNDSTMN